MKLAKHLLNSIVLIFSAITAIVVAAQESYPSKPIRMIVPIAAGSVTICSTCCWTATFAVVWPGDHHRQSPRGKRRDRSPGMRYRAS